nr:hypothetical protein [Amycolatopsis sp.]
MPIALLDGIRDRPRGQQPLGVRMLRIVTDLGATAAFHQLSRVENNHSIRDVPDDCHVVRDEQECEFQLLLQGSQQIEDLSLYGQIERADRLVADDQLRMQEKGPCDRDPLALAAGKATWIPVGIGCGETDAQERFADLVRTLSPGELPMGEEWLLERLSDGAHRVERTERILEHGLDVLGEGTSAGGTGVGDVLTLERNTSGGGPHHAEDRVAECRLA